jgi:hypothetical protein
VLGLVLVLAGIDELSNPRIRTERRKKSLVRRAGSALGGGRRYATAEEQA